MENQPVPTKYRELEQLDTETLKELIRTDCYTEDLDEACILYAPEGEGQSLYDSMPQLKQPEETVTRKRRSLRRLPRRVAVVAAVICTLFATIIVAQAAGLDLWGVIVRWSEETFHFTYQGDGPSSSWMEGREELEGLKLNDYLPTWIPEGYIVEEIETHEMQERDTAIITFGGENLPVFCLFVDAYEDLEQMQYMTYEKDNASVQEQKLSNGGTVYLYTNGGDENSIYQNQNVICSISGDIPEESVIKIYESIEGVE